MQETNFIKIMNDLKKIGVEPIISQTFFVDDGSKIIKKCPIVGQRYIKPEEEEIKKCGQQSGRHLGKQ